MMKYTQWKTLDCRGAVDPAASIDVEGTLLVGEQSICQFETNHSQYGSDYVQIYPAFHNGKRAWVEQKDWSPAFGYSASGREETILSFEDGVKILIDNEVFAFPEPEPVKA